MVYLVTIRQTRQTTIKIVAEGEELAEAQALEWADRDDAAFRWEDHENEIISCE